MDTSSYSNNIHSHFAAIEAVIHQFARSLDGKISESLHTPFEKLIQSQHQQNQELQNQNRLLDITQILRQEFATVLEWNWDSLFQNHQNYQLSYSANIHDLPALVKIEIIRFVQQLAKLYLNKIDFSVMLENSQLHIEISVDPPMKSLDWPNSKIHRTQSSGFTTEPTLSRTGIFRNSQRLARFD